MATITLNTDAPESGLIHFTFGEVEFDLEGSKSFDSDDIAVITNAKQHPWLAVAEKADLAPQDAPDYDPTDPHDNPAADHLSEWYGRSAELEADRAEGEKPVVAPVVLPDFTPASTTDTNSKPDKVSSEEGKT